MIQLPRRSAIPTILQFERRSTRRLTNWASFFLPHLTTASSDDPLSLSMAAFTALRMDDNVTAVTLYAKVLSLLRAILSKRDAASGTNQVRPPSLSHSYDKSDVSRRNSCASGRRRCSWPSTSLNSATRNPSPSTSRGPRP